MPGGQDSSSTTQPHHRSLLHISHSGRRASQATVLLNNLAQLDAQFEVVEDIILKLNRIHNEHKRRRIVIQNSRTPVNALPLEIMSDIFLRAVNASEWSAVSISLTVSARRSIALTHALIWRCIKARPIDSDHLYSIPMKSLIQRTVSLPLSLHINADNAASHLLKYKSLCTRWSLSIEGEGNDDGFWMQGVIRQSGNSLSSLETLKIAAPNLEDLDLGMMSVLGNALPALE